MSISLQTAKSITEGVRAAGREHDLKPLTVVVLDAGGHVATPPHRAMAPFGEQALVSLVAEAYSPGAPRSKRAFADWARIAGSLPSPETSAKIPVSTFVLPSCVGVEATIYLTFFTNDRELLGLV